MTVYGIPLVVALLATLGLVLAVGLPALVAGLSWPSSPSARRPAAFFTPRAAGGPW